MVITGADAQGPVGVLRECSRGDTCSHGKRV